MTDVDNMRRLVLCKDRIDGGWVSAQPRRIQHDQAKYEYAAAERQNDNGDPEAA